MHSYQNQSKHTLKVAIHQPNFLPWMGYFYKIALSDTFVFFSDVEYTKRSYIRRVKIHKPYKPEQEKYLIVPLQKHSDFADISDLKLLPDTKWQQKIKAQIHQSYGKAPCYHQLASIVDIFFSSNLESDSFSKFTTDIILHISEILDISRNWEFSENLSIANQKAEANIEIVKKVGGSQYISGLGAKKYQTEEQYTNEGLELIYSDFPSTFKEQNVPSHFMSKSVISYLAWYEIDEIKDKILTDI